MKKILLFHTLLLMVGPVNGITLSKYLEKHEQVIEEGVSQKRLTLRCCGLTDINGIEEIPGIRQLKILDISFNRIGQIPSAIGQLDNLEEIHITHNQLEELPKEIASLKRLRILRVKKNKITAVPDNIVTLTRLKELDLSCNFITRLPDPIDNLISLENLNVDKNPLTKIPEGLGTMRQLKVLYLPHTLNDDCINLQEQISQQGRDCIVIERVRGYAPYDEESMDHRGVIIIIEAW